MWAETSLADASTPERSKPMLHGLCGIRAWMRGELEIAARHANSAISIEEKLGLPGSIYARLIRVAVAGYEDRLADAIEEFSIAHRLAKQLDDPWWEVEVLVFSAVGTATTGDYELAAGIAKAAARLTKDDSSPTSRAWSLYALAESVYRDDPALADEFLTTAAELARTVHNEWILGLVQVGLARQRRRLGDHAGAAVMLIDDLGRWSRAGNWSEQWRTVREAAHLSAEIGLYAEAATMLAAVEGVPAVVPLSPQETAAVAEVRVHLAERMGEEELERVERRGRLLADVAPEAIVEQTHQALRLILT